MRFFVIHCRFTPYHWWVVDSYEHTVVNGHTHHHTALAVARSLNVEYGHESHVELDERELENVDKAMDARDEALEALPHSEHRSGSQEPSAI